MEYLYSKANVLTAFLPLGHHINTLMLLLPPRDFVRFVPALFEILEGFLKEIVNGLHS